MLIEDTDESVRAAAIKSIAINTVYIYDTDKYAQVNNVYIVDLILRCCLIVITIIKSISKPSLNVNIRLNNF